MPVPRGRGRWHTLAKGTPVSGGRGRWHTLRGVQPHPNFGGYQDSHFGGYRNAGHVQMRRGKSKMAPWAPRTRFVVPKARFRTAEMAPPAPWAQFAVPKASLWHVETVPSTHRTRNVVSKAAYRLTKRRLGHAALQTLCQERHISSGNAAWSTQNTESWRRTGRFQPRICPVPHHVSMRN